MAWIAVELDDTLVQRQPDPMTGEDTGQDMPTEGAVQTMQQLAADGHRLTVFTSRFAPMPDSERNRIKEQLEQELASMGFPPMEVWTGYTKPMADLFIDSKAVTYDNDWGLALAQLQYMMEERGLVPGPQPEGEEMPEGPPDGMG